jgi:N-acetylglutamate synthase-like GNAT family acetyltransferase
MTVSIRPARAGDQPAITALVRRARLNPARLDWPGFMVAERDGRLLGVAQLRPHPDGAVELASLVVEPKSRGEGLATRLIDALLAGVTTDVYTLVDRPHTGHFGRWGFTEIAPAALPGSLARTYRTGRLATAVISVLSRRQIRIVPLRRPAPA